MMNFADLNDVNFNKLLGLVSDVSLVISDKGFIEDVSTGQDTMATLGCHNWLGKRWIDTVTSESKKKIQDLLVTQPEPQSLLWRHVNHPMPSGGEAAIQYITVALKGNKLLAIGRNLERLAELQRRLVETQQSMERDFLRLRHIEARYRVLFETSPEAVLVVDTHSYRLIEPMQAPNRFSKTLVNDWWVGISESALSPKVKARFNPCSKPPLRPAELKYVPPPFSDLPRP